MIKPSIGTYTIYTKDDCNYCDKVKDLLKNEKVIIVSCDDIVDDPERKKIFLEMMDFLTIFPHRTFPFVFKDDIFIGGFDETLKIYNWSISDDF
jgi:glutaredoxin